MEELNNLCGSKELSLTALREKISDLSTGDIEEAYNDHPFLHSICMNKNVTLEMVECIIDSFSGVATWKTNIFDNIRSTTTSYTLHCACHNEHCPGSVIKLLLKEYSSSIKVISIVKSEQYKWGVKGLPLHHYLKRTSNIDTDIVVLLVEAYPQSMLGVNGSSYTPLHDILCNQSANNLKEVLECLLWLSPLSIRVVDGEGCTPLLLACYNRHVTLEVVQMLYNAWLEAIGMSDSDGYFPIHELCRNQKLDESVALSLLHFMIGIDPTLVREREGEDDYLPIHLAVDGNSFEFCKVLIDAYPESLRVGRANDGKLPIHMACRKGGTDIIHYILELYPEGINVRDGDGLLPIHHAAHIETVQYLLDLYPESINAVNDGGMLPIHLAARLGRTGIIELLLKQDPDMASKKTTNDARQLPLHLACRYGRIEAVKVLYDALPEAILVRNGHEKIPIQVISNQLQNSSTIVNFLQAQLVYAHKAKDMTTMTTPDENGWLPLHHALKGKIPLGSIKLLLKGNPSAIRTVDDNLAFPLHIACQFSTVKVVRHLVELDSRIPVGRLDMNNDSVLHYACRGGNLDVLRYLVDCHGSLVSNTNTDDKLPFHLLLECEDEQVRESLEFTEACFQLLRAHPETVTMQTSRKRRRD